MQKFCAFVFAGLLCVYAAATYAAVIVQPTTAIEEIAASERIVRARVASATSAWERDPSGNSHIYTTYVLAVQETLKGAPDAEIKLRQRGGTVGEITERVTTSFALSVGDEGVFLLGDGNGGHPRLRHILAVSGTRVLVDDALVEIETLARELRNWDGQSVGDLANAIAGPPPVASAPRLVGATAGEPRDQFGDAPAAPQAVAPPQLLGAFEARSNAAAVPSASSVSATPPGGGPTAQKPDQPTTLAVTATLYDAWWSNAVDNDGDGYARSARLTWDADVVGSTGSLSVYFKLYYKTASSSSWSWLRPDRHTP